MADVLKRLGDKASETWKTIKSIPPSESEAEGLRQVQQNVNQVSDPKPIAKTSTETSPKDLVNPLARYGDRPGEKRLSSVGDEIPSYDDGGDVPEDQIAKVHEGEKILSPEEAAAYRAEHPEEEKGAPAGFPGMVLPNPDHVKPVLDTEIEKKTDTDRLPVGVKADISNAPVKTPEGDISNPPKADTAKPGAMHEISTGLKPYSQVMDDKANAKAQEIVASQPAPEAAPVEEKPKVTYGHLLAEQWLQRNGVTPNKPSDVVPPPPESANLPVDTRKGPGLPQMALPPAGAAPTAPLTGKAAYQAKIKDYETQKQDLMDKAAKDNDPALREQAARVQEAELAYKKQHPWGAPESAHPGILGRLGHVGEMVAQRTPFFGINALTSTIPGSEAYRAGQERATEGQVKEATEQEAAQTKADKTSLPGYKQIVGGAVDPKNPAAGPQIAFSNEKNPNDIVYKGPITAKPTAGADKEAFKAVLKKIGTQEVADPEQQKTALETAHNSKIITDDEYKDALSYLGSTANAPATQATASSEKKIAGKTLYFNTEHGRVAYTPAEAKAAGLNPDEGTVENETQVAKDRERNSTYRVIEKSLNQYQQHMADAEEKGSLKPKDIDNMTTITEEAEGPDYISKVIAGAYDDLFGHPVTGYSEKLMKGVLTKNQYDDMSPAARQLVADYYTTMMAHFANMKATQGTIPRNPAIIQTEMRTIPKPYLGKEDAGPSFTNYLDQVKMRNADNVEFGGAAKKTEGTVNPAAITMPDGNKAADVAKGPNGDTIVWSGKQGDPWIDLVTGKPVK